MEGEFRKALGLWAQSANSKTGDAEAARSHPEQARRPQEHQIQQLLWWHRGVGPHEKVAFPLHP